MEMEDPDQPAPVVDPTRLLPNIIRYCLFEGDASRLALDAQFMNEFFRAHQIVQLIEFASTELLSLYQPGPLHASLKLAIQQ
jgi:hypothetical protein